MTDGKRREMIARYLDGAMPREEASAFRKRLEIDTGLRRLFEAEQMIRCTFARNRSGPLPDHPVTRKRVMAILATLPPAKGSGVIKGTVAGLSQFAKATMFTVFGVGAVVIATQFAERPAGRSSAEDGPARRDRTEQTASVPGHTNASPAMPAAIPLVGAAHRAVGEHEGPATSPHIRETASPQHETSLPAKRGSARTVPRSADGVQATSETANGGDLNTAVRKEPATATTPPPSRRALPVLRSDSVKVRVHVNVHK